MRRKSGKSGIIVSDGFSWEGQCEPDPPKPWCVGLNAWAGRLIEEAIGEILYHEEITHVFPDSRREVVKNTAVHQRTESIANAKHATYAEYSGFPLKTHTLPDGRKFHEVLQATIDDEHYFLALVDADGDPVQESQWTWEEWESEGSHGYDSGRDLVKT